jgi:predicted O-methyltransferase YrrM
MSLTRTVGRIPILGRAALLGYRAKVAASYVSPTIGAVVRWLFNSREVGNFTYRLSELNRLYLPAMLVQVTGARWDELGAYIDEIESDTALRAHVRSATAQSDERSLADYDSVEFGRRVGWYALVRAVKPSVVIETGVDKGLGACVLCAALLRNRQEGFPGRYFGTDINPHAGYLLTEPYSQVGKVLFGDSIETLLGFPDPVDVFVNDSDHSAIYEAKEYRVIEPKLSPSAIIIGDNAHATDALVKFAKETGRQFLFFKEEPANHWYPGAGIGFGFWPKRAVGQ